MGDGASSEQEVSEQRTERQRLLREVRGLQLLLSRMRARSAPTMPTLPLSVLQESEIQGAEENLEELRAGNLRLTSELRGLHALVIRLRDSPKDVPAPHSESSANRVVHGGVVVNMPKDGSCLFHSLAHGVTGITAACLRVEIADFIETHPPALVAGRPLQDWVKWESGQSCAEYSATMRRGGEWGGALEIAVCSRLKGVCVNVFLEGNRGYEQIGEFNECHGRSNRIICILYSPGHYDAFIPDSSDG